MTDLVPERARALSALPASGDIKEDVWLHDVMLVHHILAVCFFYHRRPASHACSVHIPTYNTRPHTAPSLPVKA